jgi:hypothetical protein
MAIGVSLQGADLLIYDVDSTVVVVVVVRRHTFTSEFEDGEVPFSFKPFT